jgi:hypothetical protein
MSLNSTSKKNSISNFITSKENVLVTLVILLHILTIMFLNNSIWSSIISVLLLFIYFVNSNRTDKPILLFTMISFGLWGTLLESFIMYKTNFCLKYRKPADGLNFPLWLIFVYPFYVLGATHTYAFFSSIK